MSWPFARLASAALVALMASGCELEIGSTLDAQQVATGGDPEVTSRRLLDLEAMRQEGLEAVAPSPDGAYVAFRRRDPAGSDPLAVQDLASGQIRDLTPASVRYDDNYPTGPISPDGQWIAFNSMREGSPNYELRVIRKDGTGERSLFAPFMGPDSPIDWIEGYGWSPASNAALAMVWLKDGTGTLELASLGDGSRTILRAFDWRSPAGVALSPDGQHVAYDFPPDENERSRDIFLLAIDGSNEVRLTQGPGEKLVIGWGRDGSAIYYSAHRFEAGRSVTSVWRLPMRAGRSDGAPTLVRDDIVGARWFMMNGDRIVYNVLDNAQSYWSATLDLKSGRVVVPPSQLVSAPEQESFFGWTEDGLSLWRVRASTGPRREFELAVYPATTGGAERVTRLGLEYMSNQIPFGGRGWLAGEFLFGGIRRGRPAVIQVDLSSGNVTPVDDPDLARLVELTRPQMLAHRHGVRLDVRLSPDRAVEYFLREVDRVDELVARDVASGAERVLRRGKPGDAGMDPPFPSPDGRHLAFLVYSEPSEPNRRNPNELHVMSVDGGPSWAVHVGSVGGGSINWTSDGRALVFNEGLTLGPPPRAEVRKVDVDGGNAVVLLRGTGFPGLRLHPDDRRVVYRQLDGSRIEELWVLENLIESRNDARASASR